MFHNLVMEDVSVAMRRILVKKFDVFLARPWKLSYDELTLTCEVCVKNWHAAPHSFSSLTLATWGNSLACGSSRRDAAYGFSMSLQ